MPFWRNGKKNGINSRNRSREKGVYGGGNFSPGGRKQVRNPAARKIYSISMKASILVASCSRSLSE
jgi:hypothetical protein